MSRFLQAIAALMFVLAANASSIAAGVPPPNSPFSEQSWKSTLPVPPSSGVRFGTLRVEFEKTTLGDVQTVVGEGTIANQGDAGDSVYWLCYTVAANGRAERIWIVSSGEMGGADHEVTGVSAQLSNVGHGTASCPALPSRFLPARIDHHLWLRSSARDVEKALGAPSHSALPWLSFDFEGKIQGNCEGGFDRINGLTLRVENGIVTGLQASQVTSC
jgi:hypothetical protein